MCDPALSNLSSYVVVLIILVKNFRAVSSWTLKISIILVRFSVIYVK